MSYCKGYRVAVPLGTSVVRLPKPLGTRVRSIKIVRINDVVTAIDYDRTYVGQTPTEFLMPVQLGWLGHVIECIVDFRATP